MSFQNYGDSFQGQQPSEEGGAPGNGAPQPQQTPMGQQMDNGSGQFPPQAGQGAPGTAGPPSQGSGDAKTTLWSVDLRT